MEQTNNNNNKMFQFTHPGRGATSLDLAEVSVVTRFNSRTPGGVRLATHSLLVTFFTFQFTHPGRGATRPCF